MKNNYSPQEKKIKTLIKKYKVTPCEKNKGYWYYHKKTKSFKCNKCHKRIEEH